MALAPFEIIQLPAGEQANFAYLVICRATREALAVDPSFGADGLLREVAARKLRLTLLVNTHGHRDHTAGNKRILAASGVPLAAHPADLPAADLALRDGQSLSLGAGTVEVLHTPGHTPGSLCLHPSGALITGDTLFVTRCGRADLPGSDPAALYRSLQRLAAFPPETLVYPGHDYGPQPHSTIAFEQTHNPYLRCPDLTSFMRLRLG